MDFDYSERVQQLQQQVRTFLDQHILPANAEWVRRADGGEYPMEIVENLKARAKAQGLWNLFLPGLKSDEPGTRLSNMEYAPLAEIMGRVMWASEVFNYSTPNTNNIKTIIQYNTTKQKTQ